MPTEPGAGLAHRTSGTDFKTIADFRRDNGAAIRQVCTRFIALCRDLHLPDGHTVAIDRSKFKAVNHREKNFTRDRLAKRMAAIESTIDRYLKELDRADREQEVTGMPVSAAKVARLTQGIETLKAKLARLSQSKPGWSPWVTRRYSWQIPTRERLTG